MAKILYADGNDCDIVVSPVRSRATGIIQTGIVFTATLFDPTSTPVTGAIGLLTTFEPATQCCTATIPGSVTVSLPAGTGYLLTVAATGAWANRITFKNVPINVRSRNG